MPRPFVLPAGIPETHDEFHQSIPKILMRQLLRTPRHLPLALPEPLARLQLPPLLPRSELELLQPMAVPRSPRQNSFHIRRLHLLSSFSLSFLSSYLPLFPFPFFHLFTLCSF